MGSVQDTELSPLKRWIPFEPFLSAEPVEVARGMGYVEPMEASDESEGPHSVYSLECIEGRCTDPECSDCEELNVYDEEDPWIDDGPSPASE